MTDNDHRTSAASLDELAARVRAHYESLLSEAAEMPRNTSRTKLENTLKTHLHPLVAETGHAAAHAGIHDAVVSYVSVSRIHVTPCLPERRRQALREELAELGRLVQEHASSEQGNAQTLVNSVRELAGVIDRSHRSLIGRLAEIRGELSSIGDALQPVSSAAQDTVRFGNALSHIDYVLTGSMALLVGPLPPQTPQTPAPPPPVPVSGTVPQPRVAEKTTSTPERELEAMSHAN
ncbi:MAG: hypothetical protein ABSA02_04475 [Trebonia sp.]|jgi:uncharacterized protein (DUF1778 family)